MADHGFTPDLRVKDWSGGLDSASLTVVFTNTNYLWGCQTMKTLFDVVSFFGAKPEDVGWRTESYDEHGSPVEELHVHFSGVDLTRFKVEPPAPSTREIIRDLVL